MSSRISPAAIEDGILVGGPRVLALVGYDPSAGLPVPPPCLPNSGTRCRRSPCACPHLPSAGASELAIAQALDAGARRQDGRCSRRSSTARRPKPSSGRHGRATSGRCARCFARCSPRTAATNLFRAARSRRSCSASVRAVRTPTRDTEGQLRPLFDQTARRGGLLPFGVGAVGLSGGRGPGAWKLVRCGAPARPHPGPARLSYRRARRVHAAR